jgi:hypothetical protein
MMKPLNFILLACLSLPLTYSARGQTAAADNKVSESITFSEMPKGPAVYGIFEGRSPCGISQQMGADMAGGCDHLKWQLILFRDIITLKPTTFSLTTEMFGRRPLKGRWTIIRGSRNDPKAVIFALGYGPGQILYLFRGDENVLFILDEKREFLTGDKDFSYTLNRVNKVLRPQP